MEISNEEKVSLKSDIENELEVKVNDYMKKQNTKHNQLDQIGINERRDTQYQKIDQDIQQAADLIIQKSIDQNKIQEQLEEETEEESQLNNDGKQHSQNNKNIISLEIEMDSSNISKQLYIKSTYFGNHIPFCFFRGQPIFTIGPDWPLCLGTILCQVFVAIFILKNNLNQNNLYVRYLTYFVCFFQLFIYSLTALLNPGLSPAPNLKEFNERHTDKGENFTYCNICKVRFINGRFHCHDCNICIDGHDHHCPWTSQCVGQGNLTCFYIFLFWTCASMIYCYIIGIEMLVLQPNQQKIK